MNVTYIKVFVDWLDAIEPLGDAERGRLFTSLLEYARTGAVPQLNGNERFIFPMMRAQVARDISTMESTSENRGKRKNTSNKSDLSDKSDLSGKRTQDKHKAKDKDKDTDTEDTPHTPSFGSELQTAVDAWLQYKAERNEEYKPQGLKAMISEIRNNAAEYGEEAVAALIRECMASNWQGIIFDRLKTKKGAKRGAVRENPKDDKRYGTYL